MRTEEEQDSIRDAYEWDDALSFRGRDGSCAKCGGEIESWTEEVPCCGHPYECVDFLYCYACHKCRVMGDTF